MKKTCKDCYYYESKPQTECRGCKAADGEKHGEDCYCSPEEEFKVIDIGYCRCLPGGEVVRPDDWCGEMILEIGEPT